MSATTRVVVARIKASTFGRRFWVALACSECGLKGGQSAPMPACGNLPSSPTPTTGRGARRRHRARRKWRSMRRTAAIRTLARRRRPNVNRAAGIVVVVSPRVAVVGAVAVTDAGGAAVGATACNSGNRGAGEKNKHTAHATPAFSASNLNLQPAVAPARVARLWGPRSARRGLRVSTGRAPRRSARRPVRPARPRPLHRSP